MVQGVGKSQIVSYYSMGLEHPHLYAGILPSLPYIQRTSTHLPKNIFIFFAITIQDPNFSVHLSDLSSLILA